MRLILILLIILQFNNIAYSKENNIQTVIKKDTLLTSNMIIKYGESCTIMPGVNVTIRGYNKIIVNGLLLAKGTEKEPILFTCEGRERGSSQAPCWEGFKIIGKDANAIFNHCRIEGAFRILIKESSPVFDSCELTGNHYAIYCSNKSKASIKNCHIYNNNYGITADFSSPFILDNIINDNTIGVNLQMSSSVIVGRNTIFGNKTDIRSESSMGENNDAMSVKYIWDVMRQMY